MKAKHSNILGITLRNFFDDYLPNLRGMSQHTILSYRDSLKLFLGFLAQKNAKSVSDLDVEDIEVKEIIMFLEHLEMNRSNGTGTRNIRLSAIHSFFRYLSAMYPGYLDKSQRILDIPFKRTSTRTIEYLEFDEITAVLQTVDRSKGYGRRDYALLSLMFNTGARVQEIVDIKANDLQLTKPFGARLYGKGRKERICPIWAQTADVLRKYLEGRGIDPHKPATVFTNHLGGPLTRFGVRYILAKYIHLAAVRRPSLKKKHLHPHCMRHSTAIYLLKSGVDLITTSHWLGHCSINTTNKYATIDIEMKREALEKAKPLDCKSNIRASWKKDPDILKWLESL